MAYQITKLCMRSDGITANTRTVTIVFQFVKIEHYSTTFQSHIPLAKYQFATSDPVKALQITDKRIEDDIFDRKEQKV